MKILAISCSPRTNGNTVAMLSETLEAAAAEGAEVELYSVAGKDIRPCEGCWTCAKTGRCRKEDETALLLEKMLAADGIVFGVPVYFHGMSAQAKAIIDRTVSLSSPERCLDNKVLRSSGVGRFLGTDPGAQGLHLLRPLEAHVAGQSCGCLSQHAGRNRDDARMPGGVARPGKADGGPRQHRLQVSAGIHPKVQHLRDSHDVIPTGDQPARMRTAGIGAQANAGLCRRGSKP